MRLKLVLALCHAGTLLAQAPRTPPVVVSPTSETQLPDAPSPAPRPAPSFPQSVTVTTPALPCTPSTAASGEIVTSTAATAVQPPCTGPAPRSPYQRFLNSTAPFPLTPRQKGLLALHDLTDPGNLFTITANAGFTVGIDPRTGYGPGWRGFGRDIGYTLVQDATGEFVSTFALDSLFHEDPHYHRSPGSSIPRRALHAIAHTVVSQHDDGRAMPNYSTLLTYPITAEISNLYVPGVHGNAASTAQRVATGLATDPIDNLITEFLPDFARRVHIRIIFVQQILNNIAGGESPLSPGR